VRERERKRESERESERERERVSEIMPCCTDEYAYGTVPYCTLAPF
jgi:hypothetical protein